MIPVLTKDQVYKLDRDTVDSGHLSQEQLMDNAGKTVAQFFCEKIKDPFNQKVVVVCGKGNNGGDGVITHSYLKKYNISSKIVFTEEKHGHSNLIEKYKISKNDYTTYNNKIYFDKYDWIIDGIFGIGLSRDLNDKYIQITQNINKNKNIISIDISSGLYTNSNKSKCFINSKYVVTFGYPKLCHYLNCTDSLIVKNIGFKEICKLDFQLINKVNITKILKPFKINKDVHKYTMGEVSIIAGSTTYPGAAILSAQSAYRTGSGYVRLHMHDSDLNLINNIKTNYPDIVVNEIEHRTQFNKFTLLGPGIDKTLSKNLLNEINTSNFSSVIDSGAFTSFDNINDYPDKTILTPHLGEFKNIFDDKINETECLYSSLNERESTFSNVILDKFLFKSVQGIINQRIIILKTFNTFIITKDMVYIMDKGPSLLATAGTGDVLSGILISLLSQGYSRLEASILGTYLHAEAANYYMNNVSKDGMTASDLIDCIPHAFNKLRDND